MSRRKLLNLIDNSSKKLPDNKKFLQDVMTCIERVDQLNGYTPSKWYKPSSLHCMRSMYFVRTEAPVDITTTDYQSIGMADTGTRRHEAIQEVLLRLKDLGYDWEYVDVAQYVKMKQAEGKCKTLIVKGTHGAETALFDTTLKISFRCDGIIRKISTNEYYLFELKNQISFKYGNKECVDSEHHKQVITYCTALDLDKAFVLYENRDTCALECPEVFEVTCDMKNGLVSYIMECEGYVEGLVPPPKTENVKDCRWCKYRTICQKVG